MNNVLHIWRYYGQRSQTWLYRQLTAQSDYTPHLMLHNQWLQDAHPEEFPFPPDQLHYFPQHNIIHRALSRLATTIQTGRRDTFTCLNIRDIINTASEIDASIIHIHFGWTATQLLKTVVSSQNSVVRTKRILTQNHKATKKETIHRSSFIVSFYGSDVFRLSPAYKKQLLKLLQTEVKIIVTSHALKNELINLGGTDNNITVIPVGIDMTELPSEKEISSHRNSQEKNNQPLKIFTVGRLVNFKAPQELPKIAKMLLSKGIDFQWVVAGDGPLMDECKQAVKSLHIEDHFTLLGSIPFNDVKQQILNSDILVHNAIIADDGSRESLGVTLMEAGAMGLPVVSCNIGGIPEVVIDNKTGILIDKCSSLSGRSNAIVSAIIKLENNPELRLDMGRAAMQHIRENFDATKLALKVDELYESVMVNG